MRCTPGPRKTNFPNDSKRTSTAKRKSFLLCKSITTYEMRHFLAPAGQPEMMRENFMHWHLCMFVVHCSCMKFYTRSL